MKYQKCPVCDGTGLVSKPPYVPGDQLKWSATSCSPYPCKVCKGAGIIEESSSDNILSSDLVIRLEEAEKSCNELAIAELKMREDYHNQTVRLINSRNSSLVELEYWISEQTCNGAFSPFCTELYKKIRAMKTEGK